MRALLLTSLGHLYCLATVLVHLPVAMRPINPQPEANLGSDFFDHFARADLDLWHPADGWTNGAMFNVGWRADHVCVSDSQLSLTLDSAPCPAGCSGKPYASGEYRTNRFYSYGRFEVRMKAARGKGIVSSFFTYTGPSDNQPWDEIDIEILGKDTTRMQTNYFTNGVGEHETMVDLGFDAADDFHTYAFEWTRGGPISWFVDGRLVHQEDGTRGPLPTHPQRIMVNLWPGTGVDSWLEPFVYPGHALAAHYDWISYTRM